MNLKKIDKEIIKLKNYRTYIANGGNLSFKDYKTIYNHCGDYIMGTKKNLSISQKQILKIYPIIVTTPQIKISDLEFAINQLDKKGCEFALISFGKKLKTKFVLIRKICKYEDISIIHNDIDPDKKYKKFDILKTWNEKEKI